MSWSKKSAIKALRAGTHGRYFLATKLGISPSGLYYMAFPERLKREKSRAKKKNGKGRKTTKRGATKKSAPIVLTATIKRVAREEFRNAASAFASLLAAQTA